MYHKLSLRFELQLYVFLFMLKFKGTSNNLRLNIEIYLLFVDCYLGFFDFFTTHRSMMIPTINNTDL